nr:hypothetical protein [Tanacetum cinerariifolium]
NVGEEKGEDVSNTVALEERIVKIDEVQARSDPRNTLESRPLPDEDQARSNPRPSHVALAGLNPEPMHEDFIAMMKEIPRDRMFKSSSYRSQPEHTALYDALKASMKHENREEFMDATAKSHKKCRDDQDPPLPPPKDRPKPDWLKPIPEEETSETPEPDWIIPLNDLPKPENNWTDAIAKSYQDLKENNMKTGKSSWMRRLSLIRNAVTTKILLYLLQKTDQSKKKRHDSDVSVSEQPIDDISILDDIHLSDSEDTNADHLPKIKTRLDWLKPIPEEETSETPKPDWIIPLNDLPKLENNWADAIAKSYQDPKENKFL